MHYRIDRACYFAGYVKRQKNTVADHFKGHGLNIIDDEPLEEWVSLLGRK